MKALKNKIKNFLLNINKINPVNLEWNHYNGFSFTLLGIEYQGESEGFEGDLLGIYISDYLIIYIFFIQIEFKVPIT